VSSFIEQLSGILDYVWIC